MSRIVREMLSNPRWFGEEAPAMSGREQAYACRTPLPQLEPSALAQQWTNVGQQLGRTYVVEPTVQLLGSAYGSANRISAGRLQQWTDHLKPGALRTGAQHLAQVSAGQEEVVRTAVRAVRDDPMQAAYSTVTFPFREAHQAGYHAAQLWDESPTLATLSGALFLLSMRGGGSSSSQLPESIFKVQARTSHNPQRVVWGTSDGHRFEILGVPHNRNFNIAVLARPGQWYPTKLPDAQNFGGRVAGANAAPGKVRLDEIDVHPALGVVEQPQLLQQALSWAGQGAFPGWSRGDHWPVSELWVSTSALVGSKNPGGIETSSVVKALSDLGIDANPKTAQKKIGSAPYLVFQTEPRSLTRETFDSRFDLNRLPYGVEKLSLESVHGLRKGGRNDPNVSGVVLTRPADLRNRVQLEQAMMYGFDPADPIVMFRHRAPNGVPHLIVVDGNDRIRLLLGEAQRRQVPSLWVPTRMIGNEHLPNERYWELLNGAHDLTKLPLF